ncbi:hypothetical protein RRG08_017808 [Elysia crispata]|uniref:Uncharacterized protein n=1 Tax=Elysia crispata TaxID=231223 RepID=A0AAE1B0U5_9GAST|nr:hypothetical protein RRG08_017808 [Elysia crispata]
MFPGKGLRLDYSYDDVSRRISDNSYDDVSRRVSDNSYDDVSRRVSDNSYDDVSRRVSDNSYDDGFRMCLAIPAIMSSNISKMLCTKRPQTDVWRLMEIQGVYEELSEPVVATAMTLGLTEVGDQASGDKLAVSRD